MGDGIGDGMGDGVGGFNPVCAKSSASFSDGVR